MIEQQILRRRFQEAQRGAREARTHLCVALICLFASFSCLFIGWKMQQVSWMHAQAPWWVLLLPVGISAGLAFIMTNQFRRRLNIVRALESKMPELNGLLLTADELLEKSELNILEHRVISQATDHAATHDWIGLLTNHRARSLRWLMYFCLLLWLNSFLFMNHRWSVVNEQTKQSLAQAAPAADGAHFVATITPGDVEVEQGSRLIVEAAFEAGTPAQATLIVKELSGEERERIPMTLSVDGKVFGGLISRVDKDADYHVEFAEQSSKTHRVTTFVFPALVRSDVKITPPEYTGMPEKEIKNTLKVTAMEDSELAFSFKVNKAVKDAELFGEDKTVIPLKTSPSDPTLLLATFKAEKSQKWRLHLVDDHERANKNPPWITVKVEANQLAKIEVVFPKRDVQVSAIQELPVEAKIWDDLGVTKSGVTFNVEGKSKEVVFKHDRTAPSKKQTVRELLALEKENAEPRQLVSYHFWAEDQGKDGEVRRAMSDMFFAEVRHFEDIFREEEAQSGEAKKSQLSNLVDLQKQVVNATWKLMREANAGRKMDSIAPDANVVHESQKLALDQTKDAMEEAGDGEVKNFLTEAWKSMKDALTPLSEASTEKKKAALNQALGFEQTALEWLYRAQSREHRVMRGNEPSSGEQAKQNQIMNLELKQDQQRYEEEKKATPEQTEEQQENLQVLNRLKELARRQEALAEKMKELQKQIEKAKTPEEKLALENQLKRLQEEQEQLLRDADELKERMESSENQANMADAKEQLEQTREKIMEAAEKLKQQQLADAANAATRAQRELEKMQEDFKEKTAKRFSEEMQQIRRQAREIAEAQKQISEALENQKTPEASADTSAALEKMLDGSQVARKMEEQSSKVGELLEGMRQISEQAEGSNPLLHRRLYEAVRNAQTGGLEQNLEEAKLQSRFGNRAEAQESERKVANSVEELQRNVEKAAESVLGSEVEALRMARNELDKLIEAAEGETKSASEKAGNQPDQKGSESGESKSPTDLAGGGQEKAGDPKKGEGQASSSESNESGQGQAKGEQGQKGVAQNDKPSQAGQGNAPSESDNPQGQGSSPSPSGDSTKPGQIAGNSGGEGQQPGDSPSTSGHEGKSGQMAGNSGEGGQQPGESSNASGQGAKGNQPSSSGQQKGSGEMAGDPSQSGNEGQSGQSMTGGQSGLTGNDSASSGGRNASGGRTATGRNLGGDDRSGRLPQNVASGGGAMFFDDEVEAENRNPLTGTGYQEWTDRLRNVEELLNQPELRNEAAKVLDNARQLRVDQDRNNMAPQITHLQMRITQPLTELRDRVTEELAKKDAGNPTVPVDRDPVPPAFRDLVKQYYKELGNGN